MTNLYSIFDVKTSVYGPLMSFQNDASAIRSFQEMLISGDKNSMLALYPTDYMLFVVGKFNQENGQLEGVMPTMVISGTECITNAINEVNRRKKMREALETGDVAPLQSGIPDIVDEKEFTPPLS